MPRATYIVPYVKWELLQRWYDRHSRKGKPASKPASKSVSELDEMQDLKLTEEVEANSAARAIEIVLKKYPGFTVIKSAITRLQNATAPKKMKPTGKAKAKPTSKKLGGKARAKARGLFKERSARRR